MSTQRDYITKSGWQTLRDELDYLWREHRPAVTNALADAAAEGDRSENAEYIYRKKELRDIDRRIRYLSKRIETLTVVQQTPDDPTRVFFGAWVEMENDAGETVKYRIVGADETSAEAGWISVHSPVARALIGRHEGDSVTLPRGGDGQVFEICAIEYE